MTFSVQYEELSKHKGFQKWKGFPSMAGDTGISLWAHLAPSHSCSHLNSELLFIRLLAPSSGRKAKPGHGGSGVLVVFLSKNNNNKKPKHNL